MAPFQALIRFVAAEDGQTYFADAGTVDDSKLVPGTEWSGYASIEDLLAKRGAKSVKLSKLLAPVPYPEVPIYCVGLNYRTHASEAKLNVPKHPPLWTKPATALANPGDDIEISKFCQQSMPDYEGELVFVTSRECRDITPEEASSYILGYTVGNDLSCRVFQMPDNSGGQFFYAKAFDNFAPIGPALVHPDVFGKLGNNTLNLKLNGVDMQTADFGSDMIWGPAEVLSWMSQSTTIPAGTAVMTGTCAGVGVFKDPRRLLKDGDVVEVGVPVLGTLRNKIVFA